MYSARCNRSVGTKGLVRFSAVVVFGSALYSLIGSALAQSLPSDAVPAILASLSNTDCLIIPTGQQKWPREPSTNGIAETLDENGNLIALAFQRLGLIDVKYLGMRGFEFIFQSTLKAKIDGVAIRVLNNMPCMQRLDYSQAAGTISRSEPLKGGQSKWTGVIAYVDVSNIKLTPLGASFDRVRRAAVADESRLQFRVLFRQDPFNANWRVVTWDTYRGGKFVSDRVLQEMQRD